MLVYKLSYKNYYYIGSTKNFESRFTQHKSDCFNKNKYPNLKFYKKFKELGLTKENFYKEIKHELLCICKDDVIKKMENIYIKLDDEFCLNIKRENQNVINNEEYYKNNKDHIIKYNINNYYNNQEEKIEYQKQYNKDNKEKIKEYQKNWYQKNKEKIKEEYYKKQSY